MRKTWNAWDVRVIVLLSLLLQTALIVLGKSRKHSVSLINRMILWFAYQSKDWVALAALGKLSNSHAESPTSNVLKALWAPLLILHLGGPDTITAYSFQDTKLWSRHLLILVVQSLFAIYVIYLAWTQYWLSILTLPLTVAGIIKYVERIMCLEATYAKKTKWIISVFKNPDYLYHPLLENRDSKIVLQGYALFSTMRPHVNDYFGQKKYLPSLKARIRAYLKESTGCVFINQAKLILQELLESDVQSSSNLTDHFDVAVAELGFIFDVVYTKAALIYTKIGCFLRLSSFICSLAVLVLFLIRFMQDVKLHFSIVDTFITMSLLVGAVALEFCAVFSMLSSDWAVILMLFHGNCLVRKILQLVLQYCPCFLPQQKRWSGLMGQFDLLDYCWNSSKGRLYSFLQKYCSSDIFEIYHRHKYSHPRFVEVPRCLKKREFYLRRLDSFFSNNSFEATRGEKTLKEISDIHDLEMSIQADFDYSIIAWHLATSICYRQDYNPNACSKAMEASKYLSNYMMYLLAMRSDMLLPEHCRSFWLDHVLRMLREAFSKERDKDAAFKSLLPDPTLFSTKTAMETAMEDLPKFAGNLAQNLSQSSKKWELIKEMWIEMLLYAAHSYQHVSHVQQLGQYGREFLTVIWIMGGYHPVKDVIMED
ncbi:hypothetical protein SLEP1_g37877 [Rubroshorea leprosula]|uniref:DUF4220 domain-containing protein n=1 Tax=Rubroshorea leprosula TaxID=152421 RepID=A0AAV5KWE8_9ROSI|nr:hypothetical protein SLEP1_g37877 [Rubroshorea leprosula]